MSILIINEKVFLSNIIPRPKINIQSKLGVMRNIGIWLGSFSTAGVSVFQMKNFDPSTMAFWETILGALVFTIAGAVGGYFIHFRINKILKRWTGIGK